MPKPLREYRISKIDDFVTQADLREVAPNFARKVLGIHNRAEGMICQRDYGSKRLHSSYPPSITIIDGTILNDGSTEYHIFLGVDGSNDSYIYVYDGSWSAISASVGSDIFTIANGATPYVEWLVDEALKKVNLYYGTSASPAVMRNPVEIKKWAAKGYFYASSSPLQSQSAGWRIEKGGGGLIPNFEKLGSMELPKSSNASRGVVPENGGGGGYTVLTGTVTWTNGTPDVGGSGTAFTTELNEGQYIYFPPATGSEDIVRRVKTIISDTSLTLETNLTSAHASGSGTVTKVAEHNTEIDDGTTDNWLKITAYTAEETRTTYNQSTMFGRWTARVYVTVMYDDGTKESDPVYQSFADSTTGLERFTDMSFVAHISYTKMNKRVSGLRFYFNMVDVQTISFSESPDSPSDYHLMFELKFNENQTDAQWLASYDGNYTYMVLIPDFVYSYVNPKIVTGDILAGTEATNPGNLAHAVDENRSYLSPRIAVKVARTQGAIVAADQDDRTVRLSSYDGDNIHEEDNFPDVTADVRGFVQKVALNGRGTVLTYRVMSEVLYVFRDIELETWDLQALELGFKSEPCVGAKAVVQSKYGISFATPSGIKHIPRGGGSIYTLNPLWQNLYDGTLYIDDGSAQYVTDAYRNAILAGYCELTEEAVFVIQMNRDTADGGGSEYVCAFYSYPRKRWRTRKLFIGSGLTVADGQVKPAYFVTRKNGQLVIGYSSAILTYPNLTGSRIYEDDVNSNDSTNSKGVETDFIVNCGGLSSAIPTANVKGIKVLHKGSSVDKSGLATLRLYANNEKNPFDTKKFRIDDPPIMREIDRRGSLEALRVRVSLPTTGISNFKDFDVQDIVLGYDDVVVQGNR